MTDKEKLEKLLTEFGVKFSIGQQEGWHDTITVIENLYDRNSKVGGYCGFYTTFVFDKTGKFISMGAWE